MLLFQTYSNLLLQLFVICMKPLDEPLFILLRAPDPRKVELVVSVAICCLLNSAVMTIFSF